jgi:hypothetical protein
MIKRIYLLLITSSFLLRAQTPVVSTPSAPPRAGTDWGSYMVTNSFDTGYRFALVGGDQDLYRSNANYQNGLRLFSSSFAANSKQGRATAFDSLQISTHGLGNDPYGSATAHIEKNNIYRYEGSWRRSQYYNPFQGNGESGNLKTTQRQMQNHDLTVDATRWMKVRVGYSGNKETGPQVSTYQLYIGGLYPLPTASEPGATHGASTLALLRDTRRDWNEYRAGADLDFAGFRFSFTRQMSYYKEDSSVASLIPGQPYPEPNNSVASSYWRTEPMHTRTANWLGSVSTNRKRWSMTSRMSYLKADTSFLYQEAGVGLVPSGATANVSTTNPGASRRPYWSGDVSWSFLPTSKLTIVSDSSAQNNRVDGTSTMLQLNSTAATKNIFWGWYMDVARYSESMDINYRVTQWLALNGNYQYTDRSVDQRVYRTGTTNSNAPGALVNHLNTLTAGFRLKPVKPMTVNFDAGIGRDNGPYTPESLARYHTFKGRLDYRLRRFRLTGTYRQLYNLNAPVQYSYASSHSRVYTGTTSFEIRRKWWVDASYSKIHQDSFSNLYVELPSAAGPITNVRGYNSIYVSNIHSVSLLTKLQLRRAMLMLGYSLTRDLGDGRTVQNLGLINPAAAYLALAQTFPMRYHAPLARISLRITPQLAWNAGWEFYRYNQEFAFFGYQPYYRAETGYTSLTWTF